MKQQWFCALVAVALIDAACASGQEPDDAVAALEPIGQEAYQAVARFFDYDATLPLAARRVERKVLDSGTREKIVYRGVRGYLVPCYIELPINRNGRVPLVLLLHGWSGSKDGWWQDGGYISGGNLRKSLLDAGYAVMAIDAPTHGDRIAENDYATVNDLPEQTDDHPGIDNHRNLFTVNEIVIQGTRDWRRAIDYAATRPDIDAERIGMIGYSMGGWQTFILAAVEPRIRVAVACAVPSLAGQSSPIAPKDYARGIGARPFLMLMGRADSMCHPQHAKQLLDFIPGETKELIFFDAEHKLPVDYVVSAREWLDEHLK